MVVLERVGGTEVRDQVVKIELGVIEHVQGVTVREGFAEVPEFDSESGTADGQVRGISNRRALESQREF